MILLTATFTDDNWFVSWLTPTVEIVEATSWSSNTYNMVEVNAWNYKYEFNEYNEAIVYFFNYDAGTDLVNNRYMWTNNNEVKVSYMMAGWTNALAVDAKKKEKEFIDKIIKAIKEEYPNYAPNIDYIKDKLNKIEEGVEEDNTETICDKIISSIEFSEMNIMDNIDKLPRINQNELLKKINIDKPIKDVIWKIEEMKFDYNIDWLKEEIIDSIKRYWYKKKLTLKDLWTIIPLEEREEFKSLLKS